MTVFVVTEGWPRVRTGLSCSQGPLHEARTDTRTTKRDPEWPAEPARFTRRRTKHAWTAGHPVA